LKNSTFRVFLLILAAILVFGVLNVLSSAPEEKKDDEKKDDSDSKVCVHADSDLTDWIYYNSLKHVKNCKKCGEIQIKIQGHTYINGECFCGAVEPEIEDTEPSECSHNKTYTWDFYSYLYHQKKCDDCGSYFGSMSAHVYDSDYECTICGHHCVHYQQTSGTCQYCGETIEEAPAITYTLTITYQLELDDGSLAVYDVETYKVESGVPYYVEYPTIDLYRPASYGYSGVYTIYEDSAYTVTYTKQGVAQPL